MWCFLVKMSHCSGVNPVKENIPICSVMILQSPFTFKASNSYRNKLNIIIIILRSHQFDSISQPLQLGHPLLTLLGVIQNAPSNTRRVDGRARVHCSDDNLHLTQHLLSDFFGGAHDMEGSTSLTVETHIFGETLSHDHFETLFGKQSHGVSISINVTTSVTLIG